MDKNVALANHLLKMKQVSFEFSITANATPASKVHGSDLPGVCILRTEGKTSEADAVEDLSGSFTTANDENTGDCVFGVLLRGGAEYLGSIKKVSMIRLTEKTALGTSYAITRHGTNGLSSGGNIAFSIAGTGLRLDTESPTFILEVHYLLSE